MTSNYLCHILAALRKYPTALPTIIDEHNHTFSVMKMVIKQYDMKVFIA